MVLAVDQGEDSHGTRIIASPARNVVTGCSTVNDAVVLRADGLVKRFRGVEAVGGIGLTVRPGDTVGLLGPNGAGKTTTLLMLLGAITPDEGTVEICGHKLPGGRSRAMAHVGFAAGYLPLPERMKVGELLTMFAQLYGIAKPRSLIEAGLERFRISHLAKQHCVELSSGQRTLVGIVKAVLHRPRLLVLDEPTASLDPDVALRVRSGLQELCRDDGIALLVTSHDMLEVERLCRRVVFVSQGKIVADGSPAEVATHFGRGDLEGVFLHLAGEHREVHEVVGAEQTDRPA
jgi:ABC-2 type transport system ATP-binding protein